MDLKDQQIKDLEDDIRRLNEEIQDSEDMATDQDYKFCQILQAARKCVRIGGPGAFIMRDALLELAIQNDMERIDDIIDDAMRVE